MDKFKKMFMNNLLQILIAGGMTFAIGQLVDIKLGTEVTHENFVQLEAIYYENLEVEAEAKEIEADAEVRAIYIAAEDVLKTLHSENIETPAEIIEYLAERPAGITALTAGVNNPVVYPELEKVYNGIAISSKIAYGN